MRPIERTIESEQRTSASRIPDFYLVGVAKCGTTALYSYLREHPNVFMPDLKEPCYFCYDLPGRRTIVDEAAYLALFAAAPAHAILGEASVWYLFSKFAIPAILERNPDARMIAILRNPIDMAYAYHSQRMLDLREDVIDFSKAWSLQESRKKGHHIPQYCDEPKLMQYRELCSFADQVQRFFDCVPGPQRLLLIYEEFRKDPKGTYHAMLNFLGLPDDKRSDFPRVNPRKVLRSRKLAEWNRSIPRRLGRFYGSMKGAINAVGMRPRRILQRCNMAMQPRPPLNERFRRQLTGELVADVRKLERLLGRTLDCWDDFK